MSERRKDAVDPDATVMIPAGAGGEADPDSTILMPPAALRPAPVAEDSDATVMISASEPDPDATVAIPTPGRRREAAASAPAGRAGSAEELGSLGGLNPLVAAANPILAVVAQFRQALRHPDPEGLRSSLRAGLEAFKRDAQAAGIVDETIDAASFALCALIDESAASTPWGAEWLSSGLLAERHGESEAGLKFFAMLEAHLAEPGPHLDLIEFLYVCLALGFEGKYRGVEGGRQELAQWRARLRDLLAEQRPRHDGFLSGHWRGEIAPARRAPGLLGVALAASAAALGLVGVYLFYAFSLGSQSDPVARELAQLRVPAPAERAPAGAPVLDISKQLAAEIGRGEVAVTDAAGQSTIVIRSDHLFASGNARIEPALEPIVLRIAEALQAVPGMILVTGHTDDVPIRTARFPSNWELSAERAASVAALMATKLAEPGRIKAEGLADSEPLAPNDSAINRARNRRVVIILRSR
ncbi:MAG TPA: type VI secretion system protein TssL, long form [Burkholderiales bacterium]|jgi:type VI secretion system protein ImpK|nr:type VI secretion system protein TssL, long form [Burkholderiales bacterium]